MLSFTVFATILAITYGHLCLFSPPQRGTMDGIDKAGATDCLLLSGPCGGRARGSTGTKVTAGQKLRVTFQKNLDHWNHTPGDFKIKIGDESGHLQTLSTIRDHGEPSLYVYTTEVTVPTGLPAQSVLQVIYETKNSNAPAAFYQCSDLIIE
ncbi:uncharacterized protein LOC133171545 [Saccostrea echinata]|uniref:uncharacterized protein LOC133171545 n=1 Tax=Saccostrea echinata TaxID=191078 RepID=UPI002A7EA820|nr:uncharacterized protein LOC133171545 [Saccostrea echinata]